MHAPLPQSGLHSVLQPFAKQRIQQAAQPREPLSAAARLFANVVEVCSASSGSIRRLSKGVWHCAPFFGWVWFPLSVSVAGAACPVLKQIPNLKVTS